MRIWNNYWRIYHFDHHFSQCSVCVCVNCVVITKDFSWEVKLPMHAKPWSRMQMKNQRRRWGEWKLHILECCWQMEEVDSLGCFHQIPSYDTTCFSSLHQNVLKALRPKQNYLQTCWSLKARATSEVLIISCSCFQKGTADRQGVRYYGLKYLLNLITIFWKNCKQTVL